MPMSLRCICTVDQRRLAEATSPVDSVRSHSNRIRAPRWGLVPVWSPRVRTLLHNFAGRSMELMATKIWRFPGRPRPNPQSTAHVSPTAPMQHHLAKQGAMSPGSLSADSPHAPAVRWERELSRGATETRPRSTELENNSVAPGLSPQSLRECALSSQPRPWCQRVGILDSSACSPLLQGRAPVRSFTRMLQRRAPHGTHCDPAGFRMHRPLVHPAATTRRYCRASAMRTPSTGALRATLKGRPAAPSVSASAASPLRRRWTPLILRSSLRTSTPFTVSPYATRIPQRQACRPVHIAGRRFAACPRCTHQPALLHPADAAPAVVNLVLGLMSGVHVLDVRLSLLLFPLLRSAASTMGGIPVTSLSSACPYLPRASRIPSVHPRA